MRLPRLLAIGISAVATLTLTTVHASPTHRSAALDQDNQRATHELNAESVIRGSRAVAGHRRERLSRRVRNDQPAPDAQPTRTPHPTASQPAPAVPPTAEPTSLPPTTTPISTNPPPSTNTPSPTNTPTPTAPAIPPTSEPSTPPPSDAWRTIKSAGFESSAFSEFDATSVLEGALDVGTTAPEAPEGRQRAHASVHATDNNSYARAQWVLNWDEGTVYRSEASFFLPQGFYANMQGAVQLMGWDAYPNLGQMRLITWNSDKQARLFMKSDSADSVLTTPFTIPEGRWVQVAIEQKISNTDGWSKVYLDGQLVAEGQGDTATPYTVTRIRYGLVATAGPQQQRPLDVYFDRVRLSLAQ